MPSFYNLTKVNGFDYDNLNNARQNNYAWSMSELGDYIYVGTGRNILLNVIKSINENTQIPVLINPDPVDNLAEIWRYKKDGKLPWQKVYKAPIGSDISGFRFMIQHKPFCGSPCIYAAAFGRRVQILKSTNGVNWSILPDSVLQGTSSRAMIVQKGKVYVATINESSPSPIPLLYSSEDPEFYPWEPVIDYNAPGFDPDKNPRGSISNMAVFNNKIYVATSNSDGVQVWRTNGAEPKLNDWTLIVNKGFGNPANKYSLSIGVFKDYLYVSGTKQLPLAWFIPMGCDIIRIDKHDNWQLIVGGNPLISLTSPEAEQRRSLSGLGSGFNNPFNVYAWQIQEYENKLLISTFDDSSNMEVILNTLLANRLALEYLIGARVVNKLIDVYRSVVEILRAIKYPIGFDLYVSEDGVHFKPVVLRGIYNPNNYGGRILYVDSCDQLYIGTANPFQGCEVFKACNIESSSLESCDEMYFRCLKKAEKVISENYGIVSENMPVILEFIQKNNYHRFTNDDEQ
ncbi:hypothetical protein P8V03_04245 [Clostridium sp. A1-XYC3]|uniref:Uncharacterized protein n=1 Tax=Clostridium tanneri TaxID=3037988 RepID=A0ABU4JQC7_9CLOT|nr:hypothetical protein [Clostridium sp. A1-XYC3]MDW8800360.1 hypothetical protein [Clostridium sp. A1-XYC3]